MTTILYLNFIFLSIYLLFIFYFFIFFKNQTLQLTERVLALLVAALADLEKPFSNEMQETAESVSGCLVNILKATSTGSGGENKSDNSNSHFKVGQLYRI